MNQLEKLTLYYDGACPLCQAEILFLSGRNKANLLEFIDINSELFEPERVGITCDAALAAMYGQYASGILIQGASVFSEAYRRAELPVLAWLFSRKTLQPLLQLGYKFFAKNRHAVSRLLGPTALRFVQSRANKSSL
jgi:predicted DCC family thiol-disulfide oxidoreductase YuxK